MSQGLNQRGGNNIGVMYGPSIQNNNAKVPIQAVRSINGGEAVYMIEDDTYTKMVTASGVPKYYVGAIADFNPANWDSYSPNPGGYMIQLTPVNSMDYMPLNERCKAYEKLIATGQDAEKEKYKLLFGDECLALYQQNLKDCNSGKSGHVNRKEASFNKCKRELKSCVTEFNINVTGHIESAWFGPLNGNHTNTVNVKNILVSRQKAGKFNVVANTSTFGNLAGTAEKFLFINYRTTDGEFKKYKIPENMTFDLRFPHADVRLGQTGGMPAGGYTMAPVPQKQNRPQQREDRPYQRGGAAKSSLTGLNDNSPYCSDWAFRNPSECVINKVYMKNTCAKSCAEYALANKPAKGPKKPPVDLGPDPLNDMSEYGLRKHRQFPMLIKNYVPRDSCPDLKDYVLKSSVIDVHQKALGLISEIKALNSVNEQSITLHPQYHETMKKYALPSGSGYVPCQQCPTMGPTHY
jgi:hypothetical protein